MGAWPARNCSTVRYKPGWPFIRDASQVVTARRCRREAWRTIDEALAFFPRDAFDYVWLISPPPYDASLTRGLQPVWRDGSSVLYRVDDAGSRRTLKDQ